MSVEVVVPWRGGCPHREAAWAWCRRRQAWPVTVAEAPPGPWVKAGAVMPAVERSEAEIIVVADADVVCDGLDLAVEAIQRGELWAVPHTDVVRLSEAGTEALMAGARWQDCATVQRPYVGIEGGGILVARRETILECPLDANFTGWGQEDHSWGLALYALYGPSWHGSASLIHLWHPAPERLNRKMGSEESWGRFRRYCKARYQPDEMRKLLQEARVPLDPDQPTVHPDPALAG